MSQNQSSKQDKERLHNLSKLCLREERRMVKMGILWRMLHERGYFEIHARNHIYFIHPRQVDIKNERTGEIETIYRKSLLGSQLKGIEKGFQTYVYKGSRADIEIHKEVGQLVVMGFDLRKMY